MRIKKEKNILARKVRISEYPCGLPQFFAKKPLCYEMSRTEGSYFLETGRGGIYLKGWEINMSLRFAHQSHSITNTDNCSINLLLQFREETKHRMIDFKRKIKSKGYGI